MTILKKLSIATGGVVLMAIGTINAAQAATFNESTDASNFRTGATNVGTGIDTITGSITDTDQGDIYQLVFNTSGTLQVAANRTSGFVDPEVFFFDSNGNGIVRDDDSGGSPNSLFSVAITPGTYYLVFGDYNTVLFDQENDIWNNSSTPPAVFGILDRVENINTLAIDPGTYQVNLSIQTGAIPEPLTLLGVGTALGFGTFFKRKLAKKV